MLLSTHFKNNFERKIETLLLYCLINLVFKIIYLQNYTMIKKLSNCFYKLCKLQSFILYFTKACFTYTVIYWSIFFQKALKCSYKNKRVMQTIALNADLLFNKSLKKEKKTTLFKKESRNGRKITKQNKF